MTGHDFLQLRQSLPKRCGDDVPLSAVRRKNELRDLLDEHLSGGIVQIVRLDGTPPYDVRVFDLLLVSPHLVYDEFPRMAAGPEDLLPALSCRLKPEKLRVERLLPLRVTLSSSHPDRSRPPIVSLLDHRIYHPSVFGPAICWAERFHPCMFVAEISRQIAALLRFELEADLTSALNPQAAEWIESGHKGIDLPLSERDWK